MKKFEYSFSISQITFVILAIFLFQSIISELSAEEKQPANSSLSSIMKIVRPIYQKILKSKRTARRPGVVAAARGVDDTEVNPEPICEWSLDNASSKNNQKNSQNIVKVRLAELNEFQKGVELIGDGKLNESLRSFNLFISSCPKSALIPEVRMLKQKIEVVTKK